MTLDDALADAGRRIETHLDKMLDTLDDVPVTRAMAHAAGGGKRLRGFLVLEGARLHGIVPEAAIWPACAIEALHAYSLVHDDMPCMDDDDLRRGQPTVHVRWDDATAILAGDALHSLAFELVTDAAVPKGGRLAHHLARAAGARGMVLGQALDIAAESAGAPLDLAAIEHLQKGKTGALIEWSGIAGPLMAGADIGPMQRYAADLGLAFQIADDILDVTGDAHTVGKATGKDSAAGKATFVSLLGLDEAKRRADTLVESACAALDQYQEEADTLRALARFVVTRTH